MARTATRTAAALVLPAAAALGLAGCARATATCVIRHHLAIVVFQNGVGNYSVRRVTRFTLTVRYGPGDAYSRLVYAHLALHAANGGNPPVVVRTYRTGGPAVSCRVEDIRARHQ